MADVMRPANGSIYTFDSAADYAAALTALNAIDDGGTGTAALDTTHALSGTKSVLYNCQAALKKELYISANVLTGDSDEFNVEAAFYIDPTTQAYQWAPFTIAAHDASDAQLLRRLVLSPADGATGAHAWRVRITDTSFNDLATDAYQIYDPSAGITSGKWFRLRWRVWGQEVQAGSLVNTYHEVYVNGNQIQMRNSGNESTANCVVQQAGFVDQVYAGIRSNDGTKNYKVWMDDFRVWQAHSFTDSLMLMAPLAVVQPDRGIKVRCCSNAAATLTLSYGATSSLGSSVTMTGDSNGYVHEATLPASALYYQVTGVANASASDTARTEVRSLKTEKAAPLVVVHSDLQDMVNRAAGAYYIKARNPDLVIGGGDITDFATRINGRNTYTDIQHLHHYAQNAELLSHASSGCPVCAVTGNHDAETYSPDTLGDSRVRTYLGQMDNHLGGLAYSFDWDGVHYACLHNDAADEDDVAAWVEDDLRASHARWKGLVLHCNLFGGENSSNARKPAAWDNKWESVAQACIDAKADFSISCHQHTFNVVTRGGVVFIINSCPSSNKLPGGSGNWGSFNNTGFPGKGSRISNLVAPGYTALQFTDAYMALQFLSSTDDSVQYRNIYRRRRR